MPPYIKNTLLNFFSFFLIAFSLYIFISLVSYDVADSGFFNKNSNSFVNNLGGPLGASISDFMFTLIGFGSYLLLLIGTIWAVQSLLIDDKYNSSIKVAVRLLSSIFLILCFCSVGDFYLSEKFGGVVGEYVLNFLSNSIGDIGALIFLIVLAIPALSFSLNFSWLTFLDNFGKFLINLSELLFNFLKRFLENLNKLLSFIYSQSREKLSKARSNAKEKKVKDSIKSKISSEPQINEKVIEEVSTSSKQPDLPIKDEVQFKEVPKEDLAHETQDKKEKAIMPSTELLDRALDDGSSLSENELNEIASLLETKLEEFGIEATVESVLPGPVVTRFEIQPAPGTKASKITNIAQDIARSLSVSSVRVVEVIEGKSFVGIEIPNNNRKMVRLTEILSSKAFKSSPSNLSVALGQDISGNPIVVDLAKMPHLLVAGTTGSGKSVGLNAMLLSLLFKSDPEEVRLILVDPKMLELAVYDGIPHLLTPVITDMTDASNGLRWCVAEMDRRYKLMSMMGVRNLAGFNKKIQDAEKNGKQIKSIE